MNPKEGVKTGYLDKICSLFKEPDPKRNFSVFTYELTPPVSGEFPEYGNVDITAHDGRELSLGRYTETSADRGSMSFIRLSERDRRIPNNYMTTPLDEGDSEGGEFYRRMDRTDLLGLAHQMRQHYLDKEKHPRYDHRKVAQLIGNVLKDFGEKV